MSTSVTSVVSHFPSGQNGFTTTLASTISSGATTVPLNSVAGYTNGQIAVMVVDPSDAAKKQTFTGIVDTSGVQLTSVVWTAGTNQTHTGGSTVVDYATATHISMITKGLLVEHAQTGLHTLTSSATITSSKHITDISDSGGNELFKLTATGSAVNEITVANAATGNNPSLTASGGDTNIHLSLTGKGTGGVLTKNPYKFAVYRNAALTIANNAVVTYDTKDYDTGTNIDVVTNKGRFTAPIAGFYHFDATINILPDATTHYWAASLAKNGTLFARGVMISPANTNAQAPNISATLQLSASDYVEVIMEANATGSTSFNVGSSPRLTWFSGFLLSAT